MSNLPNPAPGRTAGLRGARSWLFVPGDRVDRFIPKAAASGTDAIILDLEDAVAPEQKAAAREGVRSVLASPPPQPVTVRINGLATDWWRDDLEVAIAGGAVAIVLPKAGSVAEVERLGAAIDELAGADAACGIIAQAETAGAILEVAAIAAVRRVVAVALGGEDLAADLGIARTEDGEELRYARGAVVLACAAARCGAIDTPTLDTRDEELVARHASAARAIGFTGKLAIHPAQVEPINRAFQPGEEEVTAAKRVLAAFETAERAGSGVTVLDGRMIDAPVVAAARRVLERARFGRAGGEAGGQAGGGAGQPGGAP